VNSVFDNGLRSRIGWVAESIRDAREFEHRARIVAKQLGSEQVEALAKEFHSEHSPPEHLAAQFPRLGQWIAARQFAIFEIYFCIGSDSLPVVRRVAFGEYDWTQGNAIELLCRFAAAGIERERTITDLSEAMPEFRYEALLYAAGPLLARAKTDAQLREILEALLQVPEFKEACDELSEDSA
jgi:hypothetical protein